MAKSFLDSNGVLYLWQKIKNIFATKEELNNNKITVEDVLTSTSTTNALSANQGKELDAKIKTINDNLADFGAGDMLRSVYDTDADGIVDDAEKLGGKTPDYYATSDHDHAISDVAGLTEALEDAASAEHTHDTSDVDGLDDVISNMTAIAQGKCASYVYDTVADLETALADANFTATLKTGDVFLIKAVDVPDYWWDGSEKQILETTKVDLTTITNAEIDTIVAS